MQSNSSAEESGLGTGVKECGANAGEGAGSTGALIRGSGDGELCCGGTGVTAGETERMRCLGATRICCSRALSLREPW